MVIRGKELSEHVCDQQRGNKTNREELHLVNINDTSNADAHEVRAKFVFAKRPISHHMNYTS